MLYAIPPQILSHARLGAPEAARARRPEGVEQGDRDLVNGEPLPSHPESLSVPLRQHHAIVDTDQRLRYYLLASGAKAGCSETLVRQFP